MGLPFTARALEPKFAELSGKVQIGNIGNGGCITCAVQTADGSGFGGYPKCFRSGLSPSESQEMQTVRDVMQKDVALETGAARQTVVELVAASRSEKGFPFELVDTHALLMSAERTEIGPLDRVITQKAELESLLSRQAIHAERRVRRSIQGLDIGDGWPHELKLQAQQFISCNASVSSSLKADKHFLSTEHRRRANTFLKLSQQNDFTPASGKTVATLMSFLKKHGSKLPATGAGGDGAAAAELPTAAATEKSLDLKAELFAQKFCSCAEDAFLEDVLAQVEQMSEYTEVKTISIIGNKDPCYQCQAKLEWLANKISELLYSKLPKAEGSTEGAQYPKIVIAYYSKNQYIGPSVMKENPLEFKVKEMRFTTRHGSENGEVKVYLYESTL